MKTLHTLLFLVFPYVALIVCVGGAIRRYRNSKFTYSSLSSQFLEGKKLFWGSMPFHWGLLVVFAGHLVAFAFPKAMLAWNAQPIRLIILEVTGFTFGLCVLFGLIQLLARRAGNDRVNVVTSPMDIMVEWLLLLQVLLGLWIALGYRWGSSWFASDLSPYLWSLLKFQPEIDAVSAMPLVVQLHILFAFLFILLIPFSRLAHFLVVPLHYLRRPYQQVMWYWDRKKVRSSKTPWTMHRPKNN